jgi:hypothetical protein
MAEFEEELNYLSEKIESLEYDLIMFDFDSLKNEKKLLENILNRLTEIELSK